MSEHVVVAIISGSVTLLVGILGFIVSLYTIKKDTKSAIEKNKQETNEKIEKETTAVKLGVQAMLRNLMIIAYNKYIARGYAPIYEKENFENMWNQYEALGANGVMSDIHDKFMTLPTQAEKEGK